MQYRSLGRSGLQVSAVSFGAWAIGNDCWGAVDDAESLRALHAAVDRGVNFFDTADVYGSGHSERLLAQLRAQRSEPLLIATKAGRGGESHDLTSYSAASLTRFVERSLGNLSTDCLDLLQLHCPPTDCYYRPEIFETLERLEQAGKIKHAGVSVERVEEALKAIEYPNVRTVQIVYNLFRQRPEELFFEQAKRKGVGVIARVPLASGLLTGKFGSARQFADGDHRRFNREGAAFDRGETFAGVPYDEGLSAVETMRGFVPPGLSLAQFALQWILRHPAVSCVIPGAKSPEQVQENVAAADLPAPAHETVLQAHELYQRRLKPYVHHRW